MQRFFQWAVGHAAPSCAVALWFGAGALAVAEPATPLAVQVREEHLENPAVIVEPVEVPASKGQFTLDGAKYRTMYYVVGFGR